MRRFLIVGLIAAAAIHAQPAAAYSYDTRGLQLARLGRPTFDLRDSGSPFLFRDTELTKTQARAATGLEAWNGGVYTTPAGESFRIFTSSAYVNDPAVRQSWVGFFAWLPHGSELSRLTVYFSPLWEVQQICGAAALACYSAGAQAMVVPGDRRQVNMDQAIAHEYGHHIAANRSNDPWPALTYGPKQWATYANVCQRVQSGSAFPGDEGANYQLNPGEAFADTYRFMVGTRATGSSTWNTPPAGGFLAPSFPLDSGAYAAVLADAISPWTGPRDDEWDGQLRRPLVKVRVRKRIWSAGRVKIVWRVVTRPKATGPPVPASHFVDVPHDGVFTATVNGGPVGAALTVYDASGTSVIGPAGVSSVSFTACGQRSIRLGLRAASSGRFSVTFRTP